MRISGPLFNGASSVLGVCYMVFRRESDIGDFVKLCLPNSRKMDKSTEEIPLFVRGYREFATGAQPAIALAGGTTQLSQFPNG